MDTQTPEPALKILMVAAEVAPFAKVGGLADVAGALPLALHALGHDVRLVIPRYAGVDEARFGLQPLLRDLAVPLGPGVRRVDILQGHLGPEAAVPVYFVRNAFAFDRPEVYGYPDDDARFLLFCRAALEMLPRLGWMPDLIHCNDWHSGIIPNWLHTLYAGNPAYAGIATAYTIHNLAYQGAFPAAQLALAGLADAGLIAPERTYFPGQINLMARGLADADVISTVSPNYAREILTPEHGEGLDPLLRDRQDRVFGILNGIDMALEDPHSDPALIHRFDADHWEARALNKAALQAEIGLPVRADVPLFGVVSRFVEQKGFDIMLPMLEQLLAAHDVQFAVLATGDPAYEAAFAQLSARFPARAAVILRFDAALGQRIYGSSDFFLMPSRFEPCGLGQMFAMRYGAVPVVRQTGGLTDSVLDYDPASGQGRGFVFEAYDPAAFYAAVERGLAIYADPPAWLRLVQHDMRLDWSWDASARRYEALYRQATAFHAPAAPPAGVVPAWVAAALNAPFGGGGETF